jgi:hypothetical protein
MVSPLLKTYCVWRVQAPAPGSTKTVRTTTTQCITRGTQHDCTAQSGTSGPTGSVYRQRTIELSEQSKQFLLFLDGEGGELARDHRFVRRDS